MKSPLFPFLLGLIFSVVLPSVSQGAILDKFRLSKKTEDAKTETPTAQLSLKQKLQLLEKKQNGKTDHFVFDLPVTYNPKVSQWITFFQSRGKNFFRDWLEKSNKYMPTIQGQLKAAGLPTDLA
ncbi:MAG: murein transglycosylase, partial [Bdellovibrionaceae bacterium]|nr:murein transglycosylase [Pseudobdellovibrionaceae bacterium]